MSVWSVCLFCSSAKKTSRQSIHAQYISANHTVGPSPSFVKMSRNLVESLRSKVGSYNAPKWYQDQEYWRQERIFYQWSRLIDNNKSEALITHHTDIYLFRSLHTSRRGCKAVNIHLNITACTGKKIAYIFLYNLTFRGSTKVRTILLSNKLCWINKF